MTQIEQQFQNHPLWKSAEALSGLLDKAPEATATDAFEHLERLHWLVRTLEAYRDSLDPVAVPKQLLDNAANNMGSVMSGVQQYTNQPAQWQPHLTQAAGAYTDAVLTSLYALPAPPQTAGANAVREAATDLRKHSQRMIDSLRKEVDTLQAEIGNQRERLNAVSVEHEQRSTAAADAAESRVAELEGAIAQAQQGITQQSARLDAALTAHQTAFDAAQTERAEKSQKAVEQFRTEGTAAILETRDESVSALGEQQEKADTVLKQLDVLHEQASDLVEATGRRAITTEYGAYADNERKNAFWWSVVAVVLALGGFGFIAYEIARIGNDSVSWQLTLFKITGSLALLAVAGYAGKQASEHRGQERDAKRTQLDINAVEPFLSRLPDEQQTQLRAEIANRVFSRPAEHRKVAKSQFDADAFGGAMGQAMKHLTDKSQT